MRLVRTRVTALILGLHIAASAAPASAEGMLDDEEAEDEEEEDGSSNVKKKRGEDANNAVYIELGGPAIIYSVNYERRISDFNIRVGVGGAAFDGAGYLIAPIGANYIGLGSMNHHAELGVTANVGFTGVNGGGEVFFASFSPIAGYRFQERDGGFSFRAGIAPIVGVTNQGSAAFGFLPLPYVSFGAAF